MTNAVVDASKPSGSVGFIGLGKMGAPMLRNVVSSGFDVTAFDLSEAARQAAADAGAKTAATAAGAADGAEIVVTALPAATHVRAVYAGEGGVFEAMRAGALAIDCSTIDPTTARELASAGAARGVGFVDSPMSGGVGGASAGSLTFMVGGSEADFARAQPVLSAMGKNIFHAGDVGAGCAAKICNNMLIGITMIGVCEAFTLADKLGLDAEMLYAIASTSTGRCWALNDYCPAPGPVPAAPSNHDYQPGFATALMLKDLRLAMSAAQASGAPTPLGAQATQLYGLMDAAGGADLDFSGIIKILQGEL